MSDAIARRGRSVEWLALLSFALASLWLLGIGSLFALYLGWRSLRRMKAQPEVRGRTVAWAGIGVAILGVVLAGLWIGLSLTA
jgi:hypothetical protein